MILRPSRLAAALAAGELSEKDKFKYLLLSGLFGLLTGQKVAASLPRWEGDHLIYFMLSVVITVGGLVSCFLANAAGDNERFLERYVCLSAPLEIAIYALFYVVYYGVGVALNVGGEASRAQSEWYATRMSLVFSIGTLAVYFLWLRRLLQRAAGARLSHPKS